MTIKSFEDLTTWAKAHDLTLKIYAVTRNFPNEENFCITNQMRRSSISICANISEGYKKSSKEFIRFLNISQGSLEETKYYLILSTDLGYLQLNTFGSLIEQCNEIGKMISGLIRALKNKSLS